MDRIKRIDTNKAQQYHDKTGKFSVSMNRRGYSLCAFKSVSLYLCQLTLLCIMITFTNISYAAPDDGIFAENAPELDSTTPEPSKLELGNYDVSEKTGAATYTFPINVPPGRNEISVMEVEPRS